jgi:choline dehydrogenase-like flavoprotein
LSEAGYQVVVLEKGPHIDPHTDFRQTQDPAYLRKYLKGLSGDRLGTTFAEALGGGSGFYEMVSLRAPSKAFDQCEASGRRLWPAAVDRAELDPFYERAEAMLHVEQIPVERVPRTGLVFSLLMKNLGYSCDRARYAARGCIGSGFCVTGCIYAAKQALLLNYLPQAQSMGARILTDMEADSIAPLDLPGRRRAGPSLREQPARYEVRFHKVDRPKRQYRIHARLVVLGGGTIGSAKLLLASREQLPLLSWHVGRNIAFNGSVKVVGLLPDDFPDGDMFTGQSHPGMISYQFLETHGITIAAAKPLPLQIMAGARLAPEGVPRGEGQWGEANVELIKSLRTRGIVLFALGLTPPSATLTLDELNKPQLDLAMTRGLREYHTRTRNLLIDILRRNEGHVLNEQFIDQSGRPRPEPSFSTTHHTGSCRMADSKAHGVVSASGEVFDYPGLYIADGSTIPSSLAVNTSLTILANAERIAEGIVERYSARPAYANQ